MDRDTIINAIKMWNSGVSVASIEETIPEVKGVFANLLSEKIINFTAITCKVCSSRFFSRIVDHGCFSDDESKWRPHNICNECAARSYNSPQKSSKRNWLTE